MTRPTPQIDRPNELDRLRAQLDANLPAFKALPGVVGLVLNGGMARGYGDHLSEVDVVIYLDSDAFKAWKDGHAPISTGITVRDSQIFDIKYVDIEAEQSREWTELDLWDTSYAEILYDPEGALDDLFCRMRSKKPDIATVAGSMFGCWSRFYLAGNQWIYRGDALQGHQTFNDAVTELVRALFTANLEYPPYEKWLIHLSRTLAWTPDDWLGRLANAISTGDMSVDSLKQRQAAIESLWRDVNDYVIREFFPGLPVRVDQKSTYDRLRLLVDRCPISVEEWLEIRSSGLPEGDPFWQVLRIEAGQVSLDVDALLRISPEDMYQWHYEVAEAVAKGLTTD